MNVYLFVLIRKQSLSIIPFEYLVSLSSNAFLYAPLRNSLIIFKNIKKELN